MHADKPGARTGDPRDLVTPDAFAVAPDLLGTPLATPWRRAAAILIDVTLAAVAAEMGGLLVGLLVAVVFFRVATRRSTGHLVKRWMRAGLATAGAFILFITVAWIMRDADERVPAANWAMIGEAGEPLDSLEAQEAMAEVLAELQASGIDPNAMAASAWVPEEVRRMVEAVPSPPDSMDAAAHAEAARVLQRYAEAWAGHETAVRDSLQAEVARLVAGEELARLQARHAQYRRRIDTLEAEVERLAEAAANPGLGRIVKTLADDVGITMGWVGLYFTLLLAWWGGRTPGKRLLGIRTVRLDGRPISLWNAFERFGGYMAGVSTGMLGFLQVLWDPNRQAIHDKIAGTVVIRVRPAR